MERTKPQQLSGWDIAEECPRRSSFPCQAGRVELGGARRRFLVGGTPEGEQERAGSRALRVVIHDEVDVRMCDAARREVLRAGGSDGSSGPVASSSPGISTCHSGLLDSRCEHNDEPELICC